MVYNTKEIKDLIFTRQHSQLKANDSIWQFMNQSFLGGKAYCNKSNLFRYSKENEIDYDARLKRSIYLNLMEPLIMLLTGIMFNTEPKRTIPDRLKYTETNISNGKGINSYMQGIAANALQFPIFILVDSPKFESGLSEAERITNNINPYCISYFPWQVRDFDTDDKDNFKWIVLDNSRIEKSNPFLLEEKIKQYRLWTP